jgi:site-specific recombinase XerD
MKVWEEFLKLDDWHSGYSSVDRALRHYARKIRSEKTRENFCVAVMLFCKYCGLDPDTVVSISPGEASKHCQEFTDSLRDKNYSIRYINVNQAYLNTFFRENGFTADKSLKVERYHQPARYRKKPEYVPTSDEIYKMGYAAGSTKNRAMVFALYTSGLRNSTLRAVRFGDVREELESGQNFVKISVYPEMKKIDPAACKGNIPYYTFVGSEAVKVMRDYLEERRQRHGSILEEEPLFCSDSNQISSEKQQGVPVSKKGLEGMVTRAARQAGIAHWSDVTPKCLRKAFESVLRNNGLDPKDQEFLMGHILPGVQDPYYDSTKVEELRAKYAKLVFFKAAQVDKLEMIKAFAQTLGISNIEVKIQKLKEKQGSLGEMEALGKIMRQELGMKPLENRTFKRRRKEENGNNNRKYQSRIVNEKELLPLINDNWEIIKELKDGKIVVRRELA